ncbi:transmembrane amino acid transporter protein-domain-containing protein [Multifurca ochricompacta]|uniref:Transmembrane amino acid transporter protein-domain-containing protein n=1 Tax=Multifurca ochricompacta TaxID=376703 RepID=A0AAD4MDG2_9AGAM|nr:transmembrane amino acid transporter protein-domain-containing protein [Multifurca ochricompacta]
MTSLTISEPVVGSASSAYSIRDAVESYRRSQLLLSASRVVSSPYSGLTLRTDDELESADQDEENLLTPRLGARSSGDSSASNLDWDEVDFATSTYPSLEQHNRPSGVNHPEDHLTSLTGHARANERSPLLLHVSQDAPLPITSRRPSSPAAPSVVGQSTFSQTLFNSTALLLGIGMLSEPLAFSYAGWVCGTLLIMLYGCITCYTAKFLAGIVVSDSRIRSYADIGKKAFGVRSMPLVNFMFCFETFSVGVILVTLYADSLNAIIPTFSPNTYKLLCLVILIPSVFLPLSLLAYTSLLGIVSTVFLIVVVFVDGLSKFDAPGSLWNPAKTSLSYCSLEELGLAFGLFMAGFGAHAALPSLARDMAEPHRFNEAMNYSFSFATAVYAIIGIGGYLMFGNDVNDEISQNLLQIPGYSPVLNRLALWMLVVTPLTKFALSTRPLNIALEASFGLDDYTDVSEANQKPSVALAREFNLSLKRILIACERISFVCLAVAASILVPNFGSIMAILGSFAVFVLCVIGPIAAKMTLDKKATTVDVTILIGSIVMALWGTEAAFWSTTR